jgi:hypothetical protein
MVDITIKVIDEAESIDLITLDEAKTMMGITTTDGDAQLQMMIDQASATIARLCNRVFAQETCEEKFRGIGNRRVFLSHWPVKEADLTTVEAPIGTVLTTDQYELEEGSGKVSFLTDATTGPGDDPAWPDAVKITYAGGYLLPDDAPLPLKHACILLVREAKLQMQMMQTAGIRMIAHKESRVMFYDPNAALKAGGIALGTGQQNTLDALLGRYIRYEC